LKVLHLGSFVIYWSLSLLAFAALLPVLSWTTFSEDDAHVMRVAVDYGWLQHYLDADVYRQLSAANYTPVILSVYKLLPGLFSLSPLSFLVFSLLAMSLFTALAGLLTERLTDSRLAACTAMLVIFSNFSLHTLITRFYTVHYVIGGVFALAALALIFRKGQENVNNTKTGSAVLAGLLMLLAMLSKEVYLVLPPLVLLMALLQRNYRLAGSAMAALMIYLSLRTYILGLSAEVSEEAGYYSGILGVSIPAWLAFLSLYARSRVIILLMTIAAVILNPRQMLKLLPVALMFGLPALAVSHGITQPELHADRLFFAMDSALAIVAVIALNQAPLFQKSARPALLGVALGFVFIVHVFNSNALRSETRSGADYQITRFITANTAQLQWKTLYVPLEFSQGNLARVNSALGNPDFRITQNCRAALNSGADTLIAFDRSGSEMPRAELEAQCLPANPEVTVNIAPRITEGFVEWSLGFGDDFSGGVLFIDRALAVPTTHFARQMVMLKPGETYQLFANKGNRWWFSGIKPIEVLSN